MDIDEAIHGVSIERKQKQVLTRLMLAKRRAANRGQKVNACPFGCQIKDLDDQGYCKHLVGFCPVVFKGYDKTALDITEQAQAKGELFMEPMVKIRGKRVVNVEREVIKTGEFTEINVRNPVTGVIETEFREDTEFGDPKLLPVLPSDRLERITCSCRVYRDVEKVSREQAEKDALVSRAKELEKREADLAAREAALNAVDELSDDQLDQITRPK